MPSHDSSTKRLVARAMARGSYSETTIESPGSSASSGAMEGDYQPLPFSPEHDTAVETVIANLVNVAMTSPPPPENSHPPSIISTEEGSVLRPPESATTHPNTPVIHHLASTFKRPTVTSLDPRAAHIALTRLVHDPIMDSYPINYKDPPTCDDYPIELGKDVDPANRHPGVGYWLNDPFGSHYFPFSIPNDKDPGAFERTGARYVHLSDNKESLIGTLGKGYPEYRLPLYLIERVDEGDYNPPPPLSLKQLGNFSPNSPLAPKIQEVLEHLRDHRLTAEVARTKRLLKNQKALRDQVVALYKTAEPLERHLLEVDMQLTSVRRHLQSYQAYSRISSTWLHLHPPPIHTDTHPFHVKPIPPPHCLALPQLQDEPEGHTPSLSQKKRQPKKKKSAGEKTKVEKPKEKKLKKNKGGKICLWCGSDFHLSFNCPQKNRYCWQCAATDHWPKDCLWPGTSEMNRWCSKCLKTGSHDEIDCPIYEICRTCGKRGPFGFFQMHHCKDSSSEEEGNDPDTDIYDLIDPEAL